MSSKFIVRQPIRNIDHSTLGFEILYYGENQAFSEMTNADEFSAADTIYHFLTQNTEKTLKGSLNFMTFTTTLLLKKTPRLFEKSELVIQIDDSVIIHPLAMHLVQQYAAEGYAIAVNEFQFAPRYLAHLDSFSYVKISFKTSSEETIRSVLEVVHSKGKKCIATEIDSKERYDWAIQMGADALQGPYVAEKLSNRTHSSAYLKSNFFRLLVALTKEEPDVDEVEQLISMDASLTFGLMRMANSVYYALKRRATTIHQAVMTLGLSQLKQWVYLLSASAEDGGNDPATEEFLKRSFMRAHFCSELMRYAQGIPISRGDAYLMGMFSTLPNLIDAPPEDILAELPVVQETKDALLTHSGRCGLLYDLVLAYERADWGAITGFADSLGVPTNQLTTVYFECMEHVDTIWMQLTNPNPNQVGDE